MVATMTVVADVCPKKHVVTSARRLLLASLLLAVTAMATPAPAADTIRVGKASATTFAFTPVEIGKEIGVWPKHNLVVESVGFQGDARMQQAMVAGSIDFSLGSGPAMGFV